MSRSKATAPLLDDALEAWLQAAEGTSAGPVSAAPSSVAGAPESGITERAMAGHSPSARALANSSDTMVAVAEAVAAAGAPEGLAERILRSAAKTGPRPTARDLPIVKPCVPIGPLPSPGLSPSEALAQIHRALPEDARRTEVVERLGMRGVVGGATGQAAMDRALYLLVDQYSPFLGFEIVFVSTVVDGSTIHRVHRGFPSEFGAIDIVPRELSFCTHAVSAREPFFVEDASKEAFFRQSDLVQRFGCRAYLGIPLFAKDGEGAVALGALCGISRAPQVIFPEDVSLAQRFARIAEALVTRDEEAISKLVLEPQNYWSELAAGSQRSPSPVVLAADAFTSIVDAQRQRLGASSSTWLVHVPEKDWPSVSSSLPPSVLVGVLDDGDRSRALLVPEEHPRFEDVRPLTAKGERLG